MNGMWDKESNKNYKAKHKLLGLCVNDSNPAVKGRQECQSCLVKGRKQGQQARSVLKLEVITAYGGQRCSCPGCGETRIQFLQIDHINENGATHRKQTNDPKGIYLYRWLKRNNYPDGFQVLCANCNGAKARFGHCPHEDEQKRKQHVESNTSVYGSEDYTEDCVCAF